jgi:hypothetical protein
MTWSVMLIGHALFVDQPQTFDASLAELIRRADGRKE